MVAPIRHLKYEFETGKLINEYTKNRDHFACHEDTNEEYRKALKDFKYLRAFEHDLPVLTAECERFVDRYGLHDYDIRPRYYLLEAGGKVPPHKDLMTLCAVNHILTDSCAPLIIEKKEYQYKTAVFNTQREHNVQNSGYEDRVLIKLSFFNLSYEELISKLSTSLV